MEYYNLRIHHFLLCTHWNILNPFPPLFLQSIPHRPAAPLSPLHTCTSPIYLTLFPHHDMLINEGDVVSAWSAPPARPPPTWLWEPPTAPLVTKNSFFCLPTPSKICSLEYICKIGHISTHCSIVPYLRLIYVPAVWIPAAFNTSMASSVVLVLYVVLRALFIVICFRNTALVPSTVIIIDSDMDPNYDSNNNTACTNAQKQFPKSGYLPPSVALSFPISPKPSSL